GADRRLEVHAVDAGGGAGKPRLFAASADLGLLGRERIDHAPMADRDGVPAGGDQPAEMRVLRRLGVDVEVLRVVEAREANDLFCGELVGAEGELLADDDILEPAGHSAA